MRYIVGSHVHSTFKWWSNPCDVFLLIYVNDILVVAVKKKPSFWIVFMPDYKTMGVGKSRLFVWPIRKKQIWFVGPKVVFLMVNPHYSWEYIAYTENSEWFANWNWWKLSIFLALSTFYILVELDIGSRTIANRCENGCQHSDFFSLSDFLQHM